MGDLRSKYTDQEWYEIESDIKMNKAKGKPDKFILSLSVWTKSVDDLKKIKASLSEYYDYFDLKILDDWIKWKVDNNEY
jgi:hypothetical protein